MAIKGTKPVKIYVIHFIDRVAGAVVGLADAVIEEALKVVASFADSEVRDVLQYRLTRRSGRRVASPVA